MLVITRKVHRREFGDDAENCLVLDYPDGTRVRLHLNVGPRDRDQVRVTIDAPLSVRVMRAELLGRRGRPARGA